MAQVTRTLTVPRPSLLISKCLRGVPYGVRGPGYARMHAPRRYFARYNKFPATAKIYTAQQSGGPSGRWKSVLQRNGVVSNSRGLKHKGFCELSPWLWLATCDTNHKLPL